MNDIESTSKKGFEFNIVGFLLDLSRKLWLIVIVAVVIGLIGGIIGKATSKKEYTSDITFIVNTVTDDDFASSSEISAQINMSQTFKRILSSRTLKTAVREASGEKYSYGLINSSIVVEVVSGTNVIQMKVKTGNPEYSYDIAKLVVETYDDVIDKVYPHALLTVCDEPIKATSPNANRQPFIIAVISALVVAIVLCALELIKFIIKDTIKSGDELSEKLGVPVLASVQFVENKNKASKGLLVVDRKTGFSFIETYKAIRTKIENNSAKNGHKVYLVTSACENEGKTTVSTNIALSLAENGKRVLLVDADFRNPSIAKILAIPEIDVGFIDVIKGEAELERAIKLIQNFNLYILADQKPTSNPSELLSMKVTEDIINSLRKEFDYIIIDTAPASVVTDASIISGFADAAIMVVREDFAPFAKIRMSVEDIDQNGAEIVGCVFNGDTNATIRTRRGGRYGKYGRYGRYGYGKYGYGKYGYGKYGYGKYGYGKYGYGYGYGEKAQKKK